MYLICKKSKEFIVATIFIILLIFTISGCSKNSKTIKTPPYDPDPFDLEEDSGMKADLGSTFNPDAIISDTLFEDIESVTIEDIQLFFETTPYNRRSFLADYEINGVKASEFITSAAVNNGINPLVILTKLQVEMSLISKEEKPSEHRMSIALGCGCPDNSDCLEIYKGFDKQVNCAANKFSEYMVSQYNGGETLAGMRVGKQLKTLDGIYITPKSKATASLYTYTPWILEGTGGNWLFWNIYKKYSQFIGKTPPLNSGWIGDNCTSDLNCKYEKSLCLPDQEFPNGLCSINCDKYCPDPMFADHILQTFCVGFDTEEGEQGYCIPKCNFEFYEETGCQQGYSCVEKPRHNMPDVIKSVCIPN